MGKNLSVVPTLARRFLLSKSSEGFVSFIAWVSVVGVALGVLALVVVTSVINGFEGELARVITGMNGDVLLYSRGELVSDPAAIEARIRKVVPEVQAITTSFVSEMMAAGPDGAAGAVLEGFDSETIGSVTAVKDRLVSGKLPEADDEVAIGAALAERLGVVEGSGLRLIIPEVGGEPGEGMGAPRVAQVVVSGIVRMGMYEYDSKFLFAGLGFVQKLMKQPGQVSSFKMKLKPGADANAVSERLTDNFGYPFKAKSWAQLNKNLFYAIRLQKAVIAIILMAIVVVAAFNVVSALMMMIHDKAREIAILKAMGLRPGQSFRLFCVIGLGMGAVGTFFGIAGGMGLNWILEKTRWIELPADIYYIGFLPVVLRWKEVGLIAVVALCISFLATLFPAISISRRSPLEGLRYE